MYTVYDKRSQDQDADPVSSKQNKKSFPSEINGIAARPKSELLTKFINKPPLFFLSLSLSLLKSKSADDKWRHDIGSESCYRWAHIERGRSH